VSKIGHPVQDSEGKKHTASISMSPYSPNKGKPPEVLVDLRAQLDRLQS